MGNVIRRFSKGKFANIGDSTFDYSIGSLASLISDPKPENEMIKGQISLKSENDGTIVEVSYNYLPHLISYLIFHILVVIIVSALTNSQGFGMEVLFPPAIILLVFQDGMQILMTKKTKERFENAITSGSIPNLEPIVKRAATISIVVAMILGAWGGIAFITG